MSLCYNPGLEHPPHPGAAETVTKIRRILETTRRTCKKDTTTHKKNIVGADDVASHCFNPGLESPPHPGAFETMTKIRRLF